jgi:hypothetical protein
MMTFAEAYKTGLEASQLTEKNLQEIDAVFEELKTEILASSENRILIERGTASRRENSELTIPGGEIFGGKKALQDMVDTWGSIKHRVSYNALLAKNTETSLDVPIAEYSIDPREGYPVTIQWADRDESCLSNDALAATLREVLSDPSTGRKLKKLLSQKATQ